MARTRGSYNFSQSFEVFRTAPLDARQKVQFYTDLVDPSSWMDSQGYVWLYKGAIVIVTEDPSSGLYWLTDPNNYTSYDSWEKIASTTYFDPSAIYAYIDGSLAIRDSSILDLYSIISIVDSSISYLVNWNSLIDASIADLYSKDVINIGDGSAGLFSGFDPSGNILLRTISGSGAAIVTQTGDKIIIGLDASFSGEVNYGVNVGIGDASIYLRKVGDALEFRELKAGSNIVLNVSDNIILIDASVPSTPVGPSIGGGVWITDINPSNEGNVANKIYSSDGNVLNSCISDTSLLTVSVLALPGHSNYKPVVTINGNPINLSLSSDKPVWTGTYSMIYNFSDSSITVHHEDGASWSTLVYQDPIPNILLATFIGGYPGTQTELKAGDQFDVSIMTDVSISSVIIDNYGAATGGTYSVSGNNVRITITIADRGTSRIAQGLRLRVVKPNGSKSNIYLTESQGSVDGRDIVFLNNTYPSINISNITYPIGQSAIKISEDAYVNNTVTDFDTISYTSLLGQLTISNSSTYETSKRVTYLSGGYNISNNNFRITATRAANNATSSANTVVWIANTPATLSVSNPAPRLRSGGNDGTSIQNHIITINSSQRLLSAPTLDKEGEGTWLEPSFSYSSTVTSFTRTLRVSDDDIKGTYNWGQISGTNLAGIVTTTNSGDTTYTLGGFVPRTVTIPAFGWQGIINVEVSDYLKLSSSGSGQTLNWSVKNLDVRASIGDTTRPQANKWSASAINTNPTTINILDKSATDSASQSSTFVIQEGI